MRKISKARSAIDNKHTEDPNDGDERRRRIPGATITSWNGSPEIDLGALFEQPANSPAMAGATKAAPDRAATDTVALTDGTQITFGYANQSKFVLTT
jgi:hypothetical protein